MPIITDTRDLFYLLFSVITANCEPADNLGGRRLKLEVVYGTSNRVKTATDYSLNKEFIRDLEGISGLFLSLKLPPQYLSLLVGHLVF